MRSSCGELHPSVYGTQRMFDCFMSSTHKLRRDRSAKLFRQLLVASAVCWGEMRTRQKVRMLGVGQGGRCSIVDTLSLPVSITVQNSYFDRQTLYWKQNLQLIGCDFHHYLENHHSPAERRAASESEVVSCSSQQSCPRRREYSSK